MSGDRDIYCKGNELERLAKRIQELRIDGPSKEKMLEFKRYLFLSGLGKKRVAKYTYHLIRVRKLLGKTFDEATKEDIIKIVEKIEESDFAAWTKHGYKLTIKKFWKWLRGINGEAYPPEVEWISLSMRGTGANHKLPEEILSPEDIKRISSAATNVRDRAIVAVLYESGCRIGEFLGLSVKNVAFDSHGAMIIVSGKTGMRRVRLVASAPALGMWLENHPLKEDPEAPLWISFATNYRNNRLNYRGTNNVLRELAKKANIKKRVNPHAFRHARATHLASNLTEAQMKELFGWIQASKMASIYVHLSGRDVDNALLELYGLKAPDDGSKSTKDMIKVCPRCSERNRWDSKFCQRCAMVLDVDTARQMERAEDIVSRLLEDPQTKKMLVQRLYELEQGLAV
jgi:integrase/recombinase XerD